MTPTVIDRLLTPDPDRYEGVRPIHVHALRVVYFLMVAAVASDAWRVLLTHDGSWDHVRAVAFCVWASYGTLSILGVLHPLRMLPIVLFMIGYKLLWLGFVAYPLWAAGTLVGSPAEEMAKVFVWIPLPIAAVPWSYAYRQYLRWPRTRTTASALQPVGGRAAGS